MNMDKCLTPKELMSYLRVSRGTVYALLKRDDFPKAYVGKRIRVPENALREWLANGGTEPKRNNLEAER
jgi:excisionase family DNA binding protein